MAFTRRMQAARGRVWICHAAGQLRGSGSPKRRYLSANTDSLPHWLSDLLLRLNKVHQLVQCIDISTCAADDNIFVRGGRCEAALRRSALQQPQKLVDDGTHVNGCDVLLACDSGDWQTYSNSAGEVWHAWAVVTTLSAMSAAGRTVTRVTASAVMPSVTLFMV